MAEKKTKLNFAASAFVPGKFLQTPATSNAPENGDKNKDPKKDTPKSSPTKSETKPEGGKSNTNTKTASASTSTSKEEPTKQKDDTKKEKPASTPAPAPAVTKPAPAVAAAPKPSVWGKKPTKEVLAGPKPDQQSSSSQQQSSSQSQSRNSYQRRQGNRNDDGNNNNNNNNRDGNGNGNKGDRGGENKQWRNKGNSNNNNNNDWRSQKKGDRENDNNNNDRNNNNNRGNNRRNNRHHNNNDNNNDGGNSADGWSRGKSLPLELLKPNEGKNDHEKAVNRILVEELLSLRLSFVAPPLSWDDVSTIKDKDKDKGADKDKTASVGPPDECRWTDDTRLKEIDASINAKRLGGDVSFRKKKKQEQETAPPLEDCKPLEVNNDTRWKAGVFKKDDKKGGTDGSGDTLEDSDEAVLKKSLLILNKLSLTKFEKLSNAFIDTGIGRNQECLAGAIELIVKKAQDEPHFAAMYAALCLKLSRTPMSFEPPGKKKKFKKMLLTECQKEFEQDTETKIAQAIEETEDEEEGKNKAILIKKHYLGHMRFIGELYKGDLISIKIMLMCLPALLEGEVSSPSKESSGGIDEEKVECFAKLMTVIGMSLEQQSLTMKKAGKPDAFNSLASCWTSVEIMAGKRKEDGPQVSNRIKFMLQDLLEMRENGWVQRREEESAKTIAQIHKEAAKEARRSSSSNNLNRSASSSNIRRQSSSNDVHSIARSSKPSVDADGFTEIGRASGGFGRSQSMGNFARTDSRSNLRDSKKSSSSSSRSSFSAFNNVASSPKRDTQRAKSKEVLANVDEKKSAKQKAVKKVDYKTPEECGQKIKAYLKEYFVADDLDDIILSIHELIDAGAEGSVARGAKVVEHGVLMVLEMKKDSVDKFLTVMARCIKEKKIEVESIVTGLNDPLEFLPDIAIDAPLATAHLATIMSALIKSGTIALDMLLNAPEYFRTDGGAAQFGCKVLKSMGDDATSSQANLDIIEKLMTSNDKELYPSGAKQMLE